MFANHRGKIAAMRLARPIFVPRKSLGRSHAFFEKLAKAEKK
jgi:hypothetical protein